MLTIVDRTVRVFHLTVRYCFHYPRVRSHIVGPLALLLTGGLLEAAAGQVTLDGKLGTSGALAGPNFSIGADLGKIKGKTLFHSFADFTLETGDTATFSGPAKIRNILTRVTGGNPSTIDGTVRSDIAGANFFFLNPAGVIFTPNAVIDVSGSFAVSTADYLKLAGGARFGVGLDAAEDSKLTTGPVIAFGFLGSTPGNITIQSPLTVAAGKTFSVVGGDVLLDGGQILAPDGRVNLVSAKSAGEVRLHSAGGLNGLLELRNGALVDVSGAGGGRVVIRGGRLVVENAAVTADTQGTADGGGITIGLTESLEVLGNGKITTDAASAGRGGDIQITTPAILVDGQDLDPDFGANSPNRTRIAAETSSDSAKATGGDVIINSNSLEMRGGSEISTSTFGPAPAGRLAITTSTLLLTGPNFGDTAPPPTWIRASASPFLENAGAGGDIVIRADSVQLVNGAVIQADTPGGAAAGSIRLTTTSLSMLDGAITTASLGFGAGGAIKVKADTIVMDGFGAFFSADTSGSGQGGDIQVSAQSLQIVNNAIISASSSGDGAGGNISVRADSIILDTADIPSGIIAASYFGAGDGGDIRIQTDTLELQNTMQIATSSYASGNGGSIDIHAKSIVLGTGASIQSAAFDAGVAGGIDLSVQQQLELTGGSSINVSAALNEAGAIKVLADVIRVTDGLISASAPAASGGSIELFAVAGIELNNSSIQAAADNDGGNIAIGSPFFIFAPQFQGLIDATTFVSANAVEVGGNIQIGKNFAIAEPGNITATGAQAGNVEIGGLEVDLSGSLSALSADLLGADTQLRPDCGVRLTGNVSSFIVLGQGGLPVTPGGFVPSSIPAGTDDGQ